jgi:hypothetical protein
MRPKNRSNVLGGRLAQSNGNHFELVLKNKATHQGFDVLKIPNGCKYINAFKIIPVKTPFDFIFVDTFPHLIFADAKTTAQKRFMKTKINPIQAQELYKIHTKGYVAGYIVNFSTENKTVFFSAQQLKDCLNNVVKSYLPEDGFPIGTSENIDFRALALMEKHG